jgi:hypothetical protein
MEDKVHVSQHTTAIFYRIDSDINIVHKPYEIDLVFFKKFV